jgi:hypothetical protein
MSITEFGALGEGIGSLLILVTLIYLAVQNRQQHKLLLSQAYQARADTSITFITAAGIHPEWAQAAGKVDRNETELYQVGQYWLAIIHIWENLFFQHSINVLDSDTFNARRTTFKNALSNTEGMIGWWQGGVIQSSYHPAFVQWVDEIIKEIEGEEEVA